MITLSYEKLNPRYWELNYVGCRFFDSIVGIMTEETQGYFAITTTYVLKITCIFSPILPVITTTKIVGINRFTGV